MRSLFSSVNNLWFSYPWLCHMGRFPSRISFGRPLEKLLGHFVEGKNSPLELGTRNVIFKKTSGELFPLSPLAQVSLYEYARARCVRYQMRCERALLHQKFNDRWELRTNNPGRVAAAAVTASFSLDVYLRTHILFTFIVIVRYVINNIIIGNARV